MDRTVDRLTTAVLVGFSLWGLISLGLAMSGIFRVESAALATVVVVLWVWALLFRPSGPAPSDATVSDDSVPDPAAPSSRSGVTIAVLVLVGLLTVISMVASTEHYVSDRDPGVYLLTGAHIAATGGLPLEAPDVGFEGLSGPDGFGWQPMGFSSPTDSGVSWPQFVHLLPSLLAIGHLIAGEELAFRITPMLGGIVLLGIYALARQLVADRWAAVATLAVGLSIPFIHFSRDAHSELMVLTLLLAAVLLARSHLDRRQPQHPLVDITVGLLLGSLFTARVDAMLFLPAVAFVALSRPFGRGLLVVFGAAAGMAIGLIDLQLFSPEYAAALRPLSAQAWALAGVATLGVVAIRLVMRSDTMNGWLHRFSPVAGALASLGFVALWLIRPIVGDVHGNENLYIGKLQELEGARIVPTYNYAEESVGRLGWYIGPLVLALAALGTGFVVIKIIRESGAIRGWGFPVVMFALPAIVYLWRPSISPDQPWAMRRQLLALVLFVLLAVCSLDKLERFVMSRSGVAPGGSDRQRREHKMLRWVWVPVAAAVLAVPAWGGVPLLTSKSQRPLDGDLSALCGAIGPDAVVVLLPGLLVDQHYPLVLRRYCGIPAFAGPSPAEHDYASLGDTASARGQRLVLVGSALIYADFIGSDGQELDIRTRELEPTIERKPSREVEWTHQIAVWSAQAT